MEVDDDVEVLYATQNRPTWPAQPSGSGPKFRQNEYANHLLKDLEKYFGQGSNDDEKEFSHLRDFTVMSTEGEGEIPTLKVLLALRSPYFEALFRNDPAQKSVKLPYEFKYVKILVNSLIYPKIEECNAIELAHLFVMADYLQMEKFKIEIEDSLVKCLDVTNVCDVVDMIGMVVRSQTPIALKLCEILRGEFWNVDLCKFQKCPKELLNIGFELTDELKFICKNGEEVKIFKYPLTFSGYFEKLFREKPDLDTLKVDYDAKPLKDAIDIIAGSFKLRSINDFYTKYLDNQEPKDVDDILQMLKLTEEFKIMNVSKCIVWELARELCLTNLYKLVTFINQMEGRSSDAYFLRRSDNIVSVDLEEPQGLKLKLTKFSEKSLAELKGRQKRKNSFERRAPYYRAILKTFSNGHTWYFSAEQLDTKQLGILVKAELVTVGDPDHSKKSKDEFEDFKKKFGPQTIFTKSFGVKDIWRRLYACAVIGDEFQHGYGFGDILRRESLKGEFEVLDNWSFSGNFERIWIKTRIIKPPLAFTKSRDTVVQGFIVQFVDGTKKSFGMELDDETNVTLLEVPDGDGSIRDVNLQSGLFIHEISFQTKLTKKFISTLGPVGRPLNYPVSERSNEWELRTGSVKKYVEASSHFERCYLDGIEGTTVKVQGAPCITNLRFYMGCEFSKDAY